MSSQQNSFGHFDRYDLVYNKKDVTIDKCIPKGGKNNGCLDVVSLYGLRCNDSRLFHMSPWEFIQWWTPVRTRPPSRFYNYTVWLEDADQERAEPGVDYVIRPRKFMHRDIYVYPRRNDGGNSYEHFRNAWFLRKRLHREVLKS